MRKISTIFTLSLVLFLTACEEPKYDFSSIENLSNSIKIQAEKEGISQKDSSALISKLIAKEQERFLLDLLKNNIQKKTITEIKAEIEKNGFSSEEGKKLYELSDIQQRTIKVINNTLFLQLYSNKKITVGAYDFSSENAFVESLKKQAAIENVPEDDAEDILRRCLALLYNTNIDAINRKADPTVTRIFIIKLLKENIGNKSIREIEAQIDKMQF